MRPFDRIFRRNSSAAEELSNTLQPFEMFTKKYESVRNIADQQHIQFRNFYVHDDKLFIEGIAPSEEARNSLWDQIRMINPNFDDIIANIEVDASRAMRAPTLGGERD